MGIYRWLRAGRTWWWAVHGAVVDLLLEPGAGLFFLEFCQLINEVDQFRLTYG
jgi:hypothetical protein